MTKSKRTKIGQKSHDEAVLNSVKYYENQGFKVKADLPGYNKPDKIKGKIPDLIAKNNSSEIVLEVETPQTVETDKKQISVFKEYADRSKNRKFRLKITKK